MTAESFFDTYRSLDEFNQFLDLLATNYPDLVTKKVLSFLVLVLAPIVRASTLTLHQPVAQTIGKTVEGRPINGVLIASANNTGTCSPSVHASLDHCVWEWNLDHLFTPITQGRSALCTTEANMRVSGSAR